MTTQKRWRCEDPAHPGVLAPGKMRRDDLRRYCIDCSKVGGRLVERTCPALETRRAAAEDKRKEKGALARARAAEKFKLADGTDLIRALSKVSRLKVWGEQAGPTGAQRAKHAVRTVSIEISDSMRSGNHGRAWGSYRAHVHIRKDSGPRSAIGVIIHEVSHLVLDGTPLVARRGKRRRPHGRNFHAILLAACQEFWPELRKLDAGIIAEYQRLGGATSAYSMDGAIAWAQRGAKKEREAAAQ